MKKNYDRNFVLKEQIKMFKNIFKVGDLVYYDFFDNYEIGKITKINNNGTVFINGGLGIYISNLVKVNA